MLDGPNAMFGLWLTFFREHCAAFVALFVTLPATLAINARFGLVLIALVAFFGVAMNYRHPRRETPPGRGGRALSRDGGAGRRRAAQLADAAGFRARPRRGRRLSRAQRRYLQAQFPVLAWWALATVATRASATLTLIGVLVFGVWLDIKGQTSVGEIVAFMGLAGGLVGRLDQINGFLFRIFGAAADLTPISTRWRFAPPSPTRRARET